MLMRAIKGRIPRELHGVYYKNGPYMAAPPKRLDLDLLDEGGYVQKIEFADGEARYSARHVVVPWRPFTVFGGPGFTPFPNMIKNAGNTNTIVNKGSLLALYDGGTPYILDVATLETRGNWLKGEGFYNSHPKDGGDTFLRLEYIGGLNPKTILHFGDNVAVLHDGFVYVHDFISTPNYYGFIDHKLTIDWAATSGGIGKRLRNHPRELQDIVLIHRKTKKVMTIPVPDIGHKFATHFIQTREDPVRRELTLSAIYYPEYIRGPGSIWTCVVCLDTMTLKGMPRVVAEWCEFPVEIDGALYASRVPHGGIAEISADGRNVTTRVRADGRFYGELAHDPRSGYRMTYSYNFEKECVTLPIFDRNWNMTCELAFPRPFVPLGLHGTFVGVSK